MNRQNFEELQHLLVTQKPVHVLSRCLDSKSLPTMKTTQETAQRRRKSIFIYYHYILKT